MQTNRGKYTDDNFLHIFFHHYLQHMYGSCSAECLVRAWDNGFDEPLDPEYLPPFMYDLAERLGYKLENNMWVEVRTNPNADQ